MKAKIAILVFISMLLVSCAPATPTQEDDVVEVATKETVTEATATPEPLATEKPTPTVQPTETPTETPIACVTLLSPESGVEIPPIGKVTFSWTPVDGADIYVLNIILPSGNVVPFETDQAFHDRYMEAFAAGGEYQWQVIVQDTDGSQICVSEVAKFDKPAYVPPKIGDNDEKSENGSGESGDGSTCPDGSSPDPIMGCQGNQ
jgi:hypothetical protein